MRRRDSVTRSGDQEVAQWERAHQAWSLSIDVAPSTLAPEQWRTLCKVLRVKRLERDTFRDALPGSVRRGARLDLEPLHAELVAAGIACRLEQRRVREETLDGNDEVVRERRRRRVEGEESG